MSDENTVSRRKEGPVAKPTSWRAQAVQLAAVQLAVMRNLSRATLLLAAEPPGASGVP